MTTPHELKGFFRIDDGVATHIASPQDDFGTVACGVQERHKEREIIGFYPPDREITPFQVVSQLCPECLKLKGIDQ